MKLDEDNNPLCGNCYGVLERGKLRYRDGDPCCPACYEPVDTKRCTRCQRDKVIVEFAKKARRADGSIRLRSECITCTTAYDRTRLQRPPRRAKLRSYRATYEAKVRSAYMATREDRRDPPGRIGGGRPGGSGGSAREDRGDLPGRIGGIRPGGSGGSAREDRVDPPVRLGTAVIPPRPKAPNPGPKPAGVPQSYRASDWSPDKDPIDWADTPFVLLRDPRFDPSEPSTWPDDDDPVWQGPNARRAGWC